MSEFDNKALYEEFVDEAKKNKQTTEEAMSASFPLFYLNDGEYLVRIIPEIKAGRLRVLRRAWIHRFPSGRFICQGEHCDLCKEVSRLESAGKSDEAYKHSQKEIGLCKVVVYKQPGDSQYKVSENTPAVMILRYKGIYGLDTFFSQLTPDDTKELLIPDGSRNMIKLTKSYEAGVGESVTFSIASSKAELPAYDDNVLPSLDEIYVTEQSNPTDKQRNEIKKYVSKLITSRISFEEPSAAQADEDEEGGLLEENQDGTPVECPSSDVNIGFGNYPTWDHPDCIVCPHEVECQRNTTHEDDIPF